MYTQYKTPTLIYNGFEIEKKKSSLYINDKKNNKLKIYATTKYLTPTKI